MNHRKSLKTAKTLETQQNGEAIEELKSFLSSATLHSDQEQLESEMAMRIIDMHAMYKP